MAARRIVEQGDGRTHQFKNLSQTIQDITLKSSGMLRCVVGYRVLDVSKGRGAFILRVKRPKTVCSDCEAYVAICPTTLCYMSEDLKLQHLRSENIKF